MSIFKRMFGPSQHLSCDEVAELLQQYLDNELDATEVPKVLAHLEMCRDCGLEADLYESIKGSLRQHQHSPNQASLDRMRSLAAELATNGIPKDLTTE